MKFLIKKVNQKFPNGYIGQNYYSATKHFHIPYPEKKNLIEVYNKLPPQVVRNTIEHEKIEWKLMSKGMEYKTAHKIALKYEQKGYQNFLKNYKKN